MCFIIIIIKHLIGTSKVHKSNNKTKGNLKAELSTRAHTITSITYIVLKQYIYIYIYIYGTNIR